MVGWPASDAAVAFTVAFEVLPALRFARRPHVRRLFDPRPMTGRPGHERIELARLVRCR